MFTHSNLDELESRLDGIVQDDPEKGIFRARRDMFTDEELLEKLGPYVIMTEKHTWGRGHTAYEAASNASVHSDWLYCQLYKSNGFVKGLINVNDIDGGAQYHFSELGERTEKLDESLTNILRGSIKVARGKMKTVRKEKVLVIKWKEEEA